MNPPFLRVATSAGDLNAQASAWLQNRVESAGVRSAFLPAGRTPEGLYARWEAEKPTWLRDVTFRQIDDILTGPQAGLFRRFFEEKLPSFDVERITTADSVADVAILGLGLNGHIAFHEPHLPKEFFGGCVDLSEITRRTLGLTEQTWGITYGASTFMKCKSILMMALGPSKRDVVAALCARSSDLPATSLLSHPDFTLLVDHEACS